MRNDGIFSYHFKKQKKRKKRLNNVFGVEIRRFSFLYSFFVFDGVKQGKYILELRRTCNAINAIKTYITWDSINIERFEA